MFHDIFIADSGPVAQQTWLLHRLLCGGVVLCGGGVVMMVLRWWCGGGRVMSCDGVIGGDGS